MGTGQGAEGSRSHKWAHRQGTQVGHLLASNLLNQLWLSCLSVPPARTPHGDTPHEIVLPGQLLRYEWFLFSVGVRNHWLGVIPRGFLLTPRPTTYTFRDIPKPWECNIIGNSVTVDSRSSFETIVDSMVNFFDESRQLV
jgi:hypothetical protein